MRKPLEVSLEAATAMRDACERHGVFFMTAFPMRFAPPLKQVKARLERGELGRLYGVNGVNHSEIPTAHRAPFADRALAGGAVMDHTAHLVDLLRWFPGEEVTEVYAEVANPLRPELEVDTAGLVTLTFESGVFAAIDPSWSRPPSYPRWGHLNMELFGERGAVQVDAFAQHLMVYLMVYGGGPPRDPAWVSWGRDPNEATVEEFVASIREGREPGVTWRDGFEALRVALACYASAERGQLVRP